MKIEAYGATDIGKVRKTNQDSFLVDQKNHLYIVADGIGGAKGGDKASRLCIEILSESIQKNQYQKPSDFLKQAFQKTNEFIFEEAKTERELRGMGTTGTALYIHEGKAYCAHVGDSRAYLFRDGGLWQLTEDHTLAAQKMKRGISSNETNVLIRSLGVEGNVKIDQLYRKLHKNDIFLLCSDGLTSHIKNNGLARLLNQSAINEIPDHLINEANNQGGEDNITVLVVHIIDTK
ncbi:MAG: serine/threonine-protein phosphatase [Deltaproteobacteria bacterium]|nr:serine/threonine-protein phosphatase [Deltaproteobacteria bacterium]